MPTVLRTHHARKDNRRIPDIIKGEETDVKNSGLHNAMKSLSEREVEIINCYFGINIDFSVKLEKIREKDLEACSNTKFDIDFIGSTIKIVFPNEFL